MSKVSVVIRVNRLEKTETVIGVYHEDRSGAERAAENFNRAMLYRVSHALRWEDQNQAYYLSAKVVEMEEETANAIISDNPLIATDGLTR